MCGNMAEQQKGTVRDVENACPEETCQSSTHSLF